MFLLLPSGQACLLRERCVCYSVFKLSTTRPIIVAGKILRPFSPSWLAFQSNHAWWHRYAQGRVDIRMRFRYRIFLRIPCADITPIQLCLHPIGFATRTAPLLLALIFTNAMRCLPAHRSRATVHAIPSYLCWVKSRTDVHAGSRMVD